jgi:hypothetical protein
MVGSRCESEGGVRADVDGQRHKRRDGECIDEQEDVYRQN